MRFRRHVPQGFDWRRFLRIPSIATPALPRLPCRGWLVAWGVGSAGALLAGYLVAAIFLFPAPIFADTIVVPRLIDLSHEAAATTIRELSLRVGDVDTTRHPVAARGAVIWQDPPPGVGVPEGAEVDLTVSGGPQRVPVPDLVGYDDALAARLVQAAGLRIRSVDSTQAPALRGVVVATRPPAGTALAPGGGITLVVSVGAPTIRVPDLIGLTREAAAAALENAGLTLGTTVRRRIAGTPGTVIAQNPAPGTLSAPGVAVNLTLVRGESP